MKSQALDSKKALYENFLKQKEQLLNEYLGKEIKIKFVPSDNCWGCDCESSPFASNPFLSDRVVCFNQQLIESISLTFEEQYALILHEIMHYFCEPTVKKEHNEERQDIEKHCDALSVRFGYISSLHSGLEKLKIIPNININNIDDRINTLLTNCFARPTWTCGRYNEEKRVAIFYNLISAKSYYFEDYSADVINCILNTPRSGTINIKNMARELDIRVEELIAFFNDLLSENLLTIRNEIGEFESFYRKKTSQDRISNDSESIILDDVTLNNSDAELLYFNAVQKPGIATSVMMELTYNCSEKCLHCYNPGATRNNKETSYRARVSVLTLQEHKRIIDDLYENGIVRICLTGGDPFSNPNAWEIIEYLYEKGIATDIFTNGQLVYDKAQKLAAYYPRIVGISVYSTNPTIHDRITGIKGSWEKTHQFISDLAELAVPMNVKCCIMRPNVKSYRGIVDFAKKYGAQPQFEVNIRESNDGDWSAKKLRLKEEQLKIVLMDKNLPYNLPSDLEDYKERKCDLTKSTCMIGIDDFAITPTGNVQPCVAFPLVFGNLKTKSWNQIMCNNNLLNEWLGCTMNEFDKCGQYPYCSCCKPCAGLNFIEHGDYRCAAETSCYMAKIRYELLERISNGGDLLGGKSIDEAISLLEDDNVEELQRQYYKTDNGMSITMPE